MGTLGIRATLVAVTTRLAETLAVVVLLCTSCSLSAGGTGAPDDAEPPTDQVEGANDVPVDADGRSDRAPDTDDGQEIEPEEDGADDGAPDADEDAATPDEEAVADDGLADDGPEDAAAEDAGPEDAGPEDVVDVSCPGDCNGHGTCALGICTCAPGYEPPACDRCAAGYVGYPGCIPCGGAALPCCDGGWCTSGLECVAGICGTACPADMVRIGTTTVCIDRYEASASGGAAVSVAGVMPWRSLNRSEANRGCTNAGKRLCSAAEWQAACQGAAGTTYPYGAAYVPGACHDRNSPGSCPRDGSGVATTGSLSTCAGGFPGIFDMSGNVWEWVSDSGGSGCGLRGGSIDCCGDTDCLSCPHVAWQDCGLRWPGLGFRCCLTL